MVDPVICTGDGHTYEREAISNWFKEHNTSPMSGEVRRRGEGAKRRLLISDILASHL